MPLWQLYGPVNAWTPEEKAELAEKITDIYSSELAEKHFGFQLPRFYTSVMFHELDPDSFFIGGQPRDQFVQIKVAHVARNNEGTADHKGVSVEQILTSYLQMVNDVVVPYVTRHGYEWEFHVENGPFETWVIDGMTPPPPWSEDERRWFKENKSSPYATV